MELTDAEVRKRVMAKFTEQGIVLASVGQVIRATLDVLKEAQFITVTPVADTAAGTPARDAEGGAALAVGGTDGQS